jgi:hypothetical protein
MKKVRITESQLRGLVKQIIKEERMLNEDDLQVKNIAKQIYTWLKQNGVSVAFDEGTNKKYSTLGVKDRSKAEAEIFVAKNNIHNRQISIKITLRGMQRIVLDVENRLLTSFPNLKQLGRRMSQPNTYNGGIKQNPEVSFIALEFFLMEKTTRKGGLVGNTQTNKQIPQQPQQANQQQQR